MNRTEEYKTNILNFSGSPPSKSLDKKKDNQDCTLLTFLDLAKELRISLDACWIALGERRKLEDLEIEKTVKSLSEEGHRITEVIKGFSEEISQLGNQNFDEKFLDGIVLNIRMFVKKTEIKLSQKLNLANTSLNSKMKLNFALEPEKSSERLKSSKPIFLQQLLQEENVKILETVKNKTKEREIVKVRRRVSEIETLQKLITEQLFIQDERIDIILQNTSHASIDVKISRTYIRNSSQKKRAARQFISIFVFILAIVLLILHHGHENK